MKKYYFKRFVCLVVSCISCVTLSSCMILPSAILDLADYSKEEIIACLKEELKELAKSAIEEIIASSHEVIAETKDDAVEYLESHAPTLTGWLDERRQNKQFEDENAICYTITYCTEEGVTHTPKAKTVEAGKSVRVSRKIPSLSQNPYHYHFIGWTKTPSVNSVKLVDYEPNDKIYNLQENITLYAVWSNELEQHDFKVYSSKTSIFFKCDCKYYGGEEIPQKIRVSTNLACAEEMEKEMQKQEISLDFIAQCMYDKEYEKLNQKKRQEVVRNYSIWLVQTSGKDTKTIEAVLTHLDCFFDISEQYSNKENLPLIKTSETIVENEGTIEGLRAILTNPTFIKNLEASETIVENIEKPISALQNFATSFEQANMFWAEYYQEYPEVEKIYENIGLNSGAVGETLSNISTPLKAVEGYVSLAKAIAYYHAAFSAKDAQESSRYILLALTDVCTLLPRWGATYAGIQLDALSKAVDLYFESTEEYLMQQSVMIGYVFEINENLDKLPQGPNMGWYAFCESLTIKENWRNKNMPSYFEFANMMKEEPEKLKFLLQIENIGPVIQEYISFRMYYDFEQITGVSLSEYLSYVS